MTLADLTAAIDMLRAHGVSKFTDVAGGGFIVEFFQPQPEMKAEPVTPDETKCACGHFNYEHTAGLCTALGGGCDPMMCSPEKK